VSLVARCVFQLCGKKSIGTMPATRYARARVTVNATRLRECPPVPARSGSDTSSGGLSSASFLSSRTLAVDAVELRKAFAPSCFRAIAISNTCVLVTSVGVLPPEGTHGAMPDGRSLGCPASAACRIPTTS